MTATAAASGGGLLDLEKELSCSICTDLLYQPLTCIPCLHTFCGSCLKEWFSWQAVRHEQQHHRDSRPHHASKPAFSCPSCRATVRETRPNATVTTLLDMFVSANPTKAKSEQEREEIARTYRPGEPVLPAHQENALLQSPIDDDSDGASRRLVDHVREMSLREISGDASSGRDFGSRARAEHHRQRRPASRRRDASVTRPHASSTSRLGVASTTAAATAGRSRSTSRRRRSGQRNVEHQSSLRSLLNSSDVESDDMQAEILRQIAQDGILDGIDWDHMQAEQEDEISDRIARAVRRRQRELAMQRASDRRTRDTSRSAQRPRSSQSHAQGASRGTPDNAQDSQARPVSRGHREGSAPAQPNRRATDDIAPREIAHETGPRPSVENRRATDPSRRGNISAQWRQGAAGVSPQPPAMSILPPEFSSVIQSRSYRDNAGQQVVPKVACDRCGTQHIEYELHYSCLKCSDATTSTYDLCRSCYVLGKGCLHWFGFGHAADIRFQKQTPAGGWPPGTDGPHALQARRYVKKHDPTAEGSGTLITLETGVFCDNCLQKTDDCYWRCESCNEGEWGFCTKCIGQAKHCTHPLLSLAPTNDETDHGTPRLVTVRPSTSCNLCHKSIDYPQSRYHCPQCNDGDYDICNTCYSGLVASGRLSQADGPQGNRQCPNSHRMLIITTDIDQQGLARRLILEPVVGGWASQRSVSPAQLAATTSVHAQRHQGEWSWEERDESGAVTRRNVSSAAPSQRLPNGGWGTKMVAYWPRVPTHGAKDELTFPKHAEITEVVDINGDWCSGVYCQQVGLFPGPYGRLTT